MKPNPIFSEDVVPVSDLKVNHADERIFLKAVVQGLMDVEDGRVISLDQAKKRLGIS